jgi:LysM repeat protein
LSSRRITQRKERAINDAVTEFQVAGTRAKKPPDNNAVPVDKATKLRRHKNLPSESGGATVKTKTKIKVSNRPVTMTEATAAPMSPTTAVTTVPAGATAMAPASGTQGEGVGVAAGTARADAPAESARRETLGGTAIGEKAENTDTAGTSLLP